MTDQFAAADALLSIPDAARALGVPETTLRRALKTLPEYSARTVSERRRTKTGERVATVLPADLIADLHAYFEEKKAQIETETNAAGNPAANGTGTLPEARQNAAVTVSEGFQNETAKAFPVAPPKVKIVTRRVVVVRPDPAQEKRIEELTKALEHEREAHRRAETLHLGTMTELDALRRRAGELEQVNAKLIEALPMPPATPQNGPSEARGGDSTGSSAEPIHPAGTGRQERRFHRNLSKSEEIGHRRGN